MFGIKEISMFPVYDHTKIVLGQLQPCNKYIIPWYSKSDVIMHMRRARGMLLKFFSSHIRVTGTPIFWRLKSTWPTRLYRSCRQDPCYFSLQKNKIVICQWINRLHSPDLYTYIWPLRAKGYNPLLSCPILVLEMWTPWLAKMYIYM